jgi:hypothetical protein
VPQREARAWPPSFARTIRELMVPSIKTSKVGYRAA